MRVRRPLAATSLAVALLAATAACGGDDPPPANGSPTDSSSPSATESSTFSPSPSQTEPPQRESAKAFIRRWNQADIEMQRTGESRPYRDLTHECAPCDSVADKVDIFYAAGGWIRWQGRTMGRITRYDARFGKPTWKVPTESAPTRYKESASAPVSKLAGGPNIMLVTLTRVEGDWRVFDIAQLAH